MRIKIIYLSEICLIANIYGIFLLSILAWHYFLVQNPQASQHKQEQCVAMLLDNGADPNIMDSHGNTALHYSVQKESISIAGKLIAHKAHIESQNKVHIDHQLYFQNMWSTFVLTVTHGGPLSTCRSSSIPWMKMFGNNLSKISSRNWYFEGSFIWHGFLLCTLPKY